MAVNLGAAYVDIVPSTRNLGSQLQKQLVAPASAAGDAAGTGFGSRFAAGVTNAMRGVADTVDKTLQGVAITSTAFAAITLTSGLDRIIAIQDAGAALTVILGDATEAATLLEEVKQTSIGTPFAFSEFATATTRLVGMGIEAQKIPTYLEAIGNSAALQGKAAPEYFSRLVRVFGQVNALGRITGQDLLQISETGVNAMAILSDEFGVSTEELRKMISEGLVPADRALDALAEGILNGSENSRALGGVMQTLRQQLSGLREGLKAATARLGEAALTPFIPVMTAGLNALIDLFDDLAPKVKEFSQRIVDSPGFQKIADWIGRIPELVPKATEAFAGLSSVIGPLVGLFASFATKGIASIPFIGSFIPVIGPIVGIIGGIIAQSPELREQLGRLVEQLAELGGKLAVAFGFLIEKVMPVIETLLGVGLDGATGVVSYINDIVDTFETSGISGVWDKVQTDWENASPGLEASLDSIWESVSTWVDEKVEQAPGLFGRIADGFTEGFDTALNGDGGDTNPILDDLQTGFDLIDTATEEQQASMKENISKTWPEAFTGWIDALINGDENGPGIADRLQGLTDAMDTWIDNGGVQQLASMGFKLGVSLWAGFMTTIVPGARLIVTNLAISLLRFVLDLAWMFVQLGTSLAISITQGLVNYIRDSLPKLLAEALIVGLSQIPVLGQLVQLGLITGALGDLIGGGDPFGNEERNVGRDVGGALGGLGTSSGQGFATPFVVAPNDGFLYQPPPAPATSGPSFVINAPSTDAQEIVRASEYLYRKQGIIGGGIGG